MSDDRYDRGWQVLREMLGEDAAEQVRERWRQLSPDLERMIVGFVAGEVWSRPGLDRRTRSLCTISALVALGRPNALELNVRMALVNGATPEEIREAILQMAPYAGLPAAWEGMIVAEAVLSAAETGE